MSAGSRARRQHMSFKRTPGNQCLGKDRYRNREAAEKVITQLPGFARVYRCPLCKYLHLTSKPKKEAA